MDELTAAAFRANMRVVLDAVENTHERVRLTRAGHRPAVLLSVEDLESLEESLEILRDPELIADIKAGERDIADGDIVTLDELRSELEQGRKAG